VRALDGRGSIGGVDWTFVYLMLVLKLPIIGLLWIVWWAVHQKPEDADDSSGGDDGGSKLREHHPRRPFPHRPRRGPHGDPPLPSPPRTRTVVARARRADRA
jgi:hypothetical protein